MQKLVVKILVLVKQTKIKGEKMGLTDIQKRLIQAIPQNDMGEMAKGKGQIKIVEMLKEMIK